ncbi:hypothetical protein [Amycolatopsis pigmentata]|uniref:Uncharacterized protein n=1 Tax=Amycolatopsis pigmentata TaxID=450801 RepID=A0ABW5FZ59_9PSEU
MAASAPNTNGTSGVVRPRTNRCVPHQNHATQVTAISSMGHPAAP